MSSSKEEVYFRNNGILYKGIVKSVVKTTTSDIHFIEVTVIGLPLSKEAQITIVHAPNFDLNSEAKSSDETEDYF